MNIVIFEGCHKSKTLKQYEAKYKDHIKARQMLAAYFSNLDDTIPSSYLDNKTEENLHVESFIKFIKIATNSKIFKHENEIMFREEDGSEIFKARIETIDTSKPWRLSENEFGEYIEYFEPAKVTILDEATNYSSW